MEGFFTTIALLLVGIGSALSWGPGGGGGVPFHNSDASLPSGPRLRRQYPGGPYQYSPYTDYVYSAPIIPRTSASARAIASFLAADEVTYCPPNNPRRNKRLCLKIVQETVGNKITTNLDKYFLPTYIQHDPNVADGLEAFREAISPGGLLFGPKEQIDFRAVGADGDLVWMHARRVRANGDVYAHLDLYRFECGKIAEHWDVIQRADESAPAANDHPFF